MEKKTKDLQSSEILKQRFESMLFSLYKPQIKPLLDSSGKESNNSFKMYSDLPPFESSLSTYRLESDLKDLETNKLITLNLSERTEILINEMQSKEYSDIDFSVVPLNYQKYSKTSPISSPPFESKPLLSVRERQEKNHENLAKKKKKEREMVIEEAKKQYQKEKAQPTKRRSQNYKDEEKERNDKIKKEFKRNYDKEYKNPPNLEEYQQKQLKKYFWNNFSKTQDEDINDELSSENSSDLDN